MNFLKSFSYTYLTFTHLHRKLIYKQYLNSINFKFYNSGNLDLPEGPDVSSSTIKRSLKTLGVNFEDGYTCLISTCPICKKKNKSSKVYINKITGFFICDKSRHQGKWKDLEKVINIKKLQQNSTKDIAIPKENIITEKVNTNWLKIKEITVPFDSLADDEFKEIAELFGYSNIPKSIFGQLSTRIDEKREHLYFPLYGIDGHEQGYKYIKKETGEESTVPYTNCSGLISYKTVKSKDSNAILVPSIKDLLILAYNKVPSTVICLPYGISVLPQFVLPCFEQYNKLTLWFGNDVLSWDTARQFSKKLDEKRCFFIRPSDKHHLPHLLESNQDIKTVLNSAQPVWHKAITTFANLREDVLCDLQNIDKVQGIKWKRFPTLNKILKGHRRGELTIMTGPTGCGKTTFMSEYSLDLAMQGVNTLWGSFEIRNARLARTMLQQMAGLSLEDNLDKFDTWADEFEKLPIYFMTFHGQQSVKIVMEAVEHATYIHDITHVIIDNVQFMMGVSEDYRITDRFWKQDLIVGAFRTFATKRNCHVTLVIHPRKEREDEDLTTSSIFGGAKASQEADNVLLIQDKRLTSVRGKKYLQIAKNRYSGDLGIMAMEFDKESLSYEQKKKKSAEEKEKQKDSGNEVVLISEKN